MGKKILDLNEPDRPIVAIDGTAYEMAVPEDFGLRDRARFARLAKRLKAISGSTSDADISDEDIDTLVQSLSEAVSLILPGLPAEKRAKLRDGHLLAIVQAFMAPAGTESRETPPEPLPVSQTGETSSQDSSGSTGGSPPAG